MITLPNPWSDLERELAIRAGAEEHEKRHAKRRKARDSRAARNKQRGLDATIERIRQAVSESPRAPSKPRKQRGCASSRWIISSYSYSDGAKQFWNNNYGWIEQRRDADTFTDSEKATLNLPLDGTWELLRERLARSAK